MKKIFVSTACLKGDKSYERVLETYINAGIKNIELTGVHPYLKFDELSKLINEYKNKGIQFTFHNYFPPPKDPIVLNYLSKNKKDKKDSEEIISKAIKLAKETQTSIYAYHPGYLREADINQKGYFDFKGSSRIDFEEGLKIYKSDFINFYDKLNLDNDTFLGIENLFPNDDGTNDSFLCTYEEIEKFFHSPEINSTNLCLLIDLGHLAISSNILKFDRLDFIEKCIKNFGERIFEIHISNNNGLRDLHSRITKDSWQLEVLRKFSKTGSLNGETVFTYESRGLSIEQITEDIQLINSNLN
jgi:sugar phosphate isomerase/epimerase